MHEHYGEGKAITMTKDPATPFTHCSLQGGCDHLWHHRLLCATKSSACMRMGQTVDRRSSCPPDLLPDEVIGRVRPFGKERIHNPPSYNNFASDFPGTTLHFSIIQKSRKLSIRPIYRCHSVQSEIQRYISTSSKFYSINFAQWHQHVMVKPRRNSQRTRVILS